MKNLTKTSLLSLALVCAASQTFAADIPERPEKLTYPPLKFQPPKAADYRVALKSGAVAYVVPDHELPLVNVTVYVRTGQYNEPAGKEGLAELLGRVLVRGGIKSKTAEELEERLAFLAAHLESQVADTQGTVMLNLLSKDLDEGLGLLREVLSTPRFQDDKTALHKQQILQAMKQRNDESASIESRERNRLLYGDNFFINKLATESSLNSLTKADLENFHRAWFHPANFILAVNGDFDRDAMIAKLEKLFDAWPFSGQKSPPVPTDTKMAAPGLYIVDKDVNQGRVSVLLSGIMRTDPDYVASQVMNNILGGGGFTSRIMNRVRSEEGLAYHAFSLMPGGIFYSGMFDAGFQSKSRTVAYATSIVLEEIKRLAAEPVKEQELTVARNSFIDTFPRAFATKTQVANALANEEFTGRYAAIPDWFEKYTARFAAVTPEDVQRVAKRFLKSNDAVILVVGQKDEILKGHPDHAASLKDLANGRLIDVPLRDPLTLKPVGK